MTEGGLPMLTHGGCEAAQTCDAPLKRWLPPCATERRD